MAEKKKIAFAEGCFDALAGEMTQEEIDAFKAEIEAKFAAVPADATDEEAAEILGATRVSEDDFAAIEAALSEKKVRQ